MSRAGTRQSVRMLYGPRKGDHVTVDGHQGGVRELLNRWTDTALLRDVHTGERLRVPLVLLDRTPTNSAGAT